MKEDKKTITWIDYYYCRDCRTMVRPEGKNCPYCGSIRVIPLKK